MLLYGELSILQDFNMVKKKSRPQIIEEKTYVKPE